MVETAEEGTIYAASGGIGVEAFVVGGLDPGFNSVERVDKEVDGEGGEGAGEENVGIGVVKGHCTGWGLCKALEEGKTTWFAG